MFKVGEGVIELVLFPESQVYEVAPFPIKLAVCPEQIVAELTVMVGSGFTKILSVAELLQLFPSVPVTV